MIDFLNIFRGAEFTTLSVAIRLFLAVICGGLIGLERERKHRPAGFRTHILICLGAAMTTLTGQYLVLELKLGTDMARLGAQVIAGVGFIGAGTIIITGKNQVKGMTTAAGLWASACLGLAIGAGFYWGALIGCSLIMLTVTVFSKIESFITSRSRNITIYIEFDTADNITEIVETIKAKGVRIFDVELIKANGDWIEP